MQHHEHDLKRVLGDVFGIDPVTIGDATSTDTVASWDSLKHLNLVIALEERFQVTFTEEESVEILNYPLVKMTLEQHGITWVEPDAQKVV